jgi:hypothetical protein
MSVIRTYEDFLATSQMLANAGEVSLKLTIDQNAAKVILLGAASEFESLLCDSVRRLVRRATNGNAHIESIVERKGISRQYHTWFDWEKLNANKFYSLFGDAFAERMKAVAKQDAEFARSVAGFLEIGQTRNNLVHNGFANYYVEKTADEVLELYKIALGFVERIDKVFLELAPE